MHGYSERETERLADQANTLTHLLHHDTSYPPGSRVLECGCGTGAQTVFLAAGSPDAQIVSVDVSPASLDRARARVQAAGFRNVTFRVADIFHLPFEDASFDHVFVCFVLEHLADPIKALRCMARVLRPGGSKNTFIAMVEGVRDQALSLGPVDTRTWDKGIAGLYRATEADGTFCYAFFKGTAIA